MSMQCFKVLPRTFGHCIRDGGTFHTDQHKHDVPNRNARKCPDALFLRRAQLPHDRRSLVRAQLPILAIPYPELQP